MPIDESKAATSEQFVCPVTLSDEVGSNVVLLIKDGPPVLQGVEKKIVEQVLECPLVLLTQNKDMVELKQQIIARIEHAVSLEGFQGILQVNNEQGLDMRSPVTNEPVMCSAICLGANREHVRATDAAIFQFICGGKKLGNADLWFVVICMALEEANQGHLADQIQHLQQ